MTRCYKETDQGHGVWVVTALGKYTSPAYGAATFIGKHPELRINATTLLHEAIGHNDLSWLMIITEPRNVQA